MVVEPAHEFHVHVFIMYVRHFADTNRRLSCTGPIAAAAAAAADDGGQKGCSSHRKQREGERETTGLKFAWAKGHVGGGGVFATSLKKMK